MFNIYRISTTEEGTNEVYMIFVFIFHHNIFYYSLIDFLRQNKTFSYIKTAHFIERRNIVPKYIYD
jgi:hypothetical protein